MPNPQHLYITSDDKIKENDWIYNELSGIDKYIENEEFKDGIVVMYNNQGYEVAEDLKNVRKIISTTDTSLKITKSSLSNSALHEYIKLGSVCANYKDILPQPSQQFIEKYIDSYNKGEIITDVLVEYEQKKYIITLDTWGNHIVPKINTKDDSITIKKLKDIWNREEIKLLIEKYQNIFGTANSASTFVQNWIKENL